MSQVFISYSRLDLEFVQRLANALEAAQIDSWLDQHDIEPAADWRERIQAGIESADNFIFVISPDSVQSKECRHELDQAIQNGKRLIPILYRETPSNLIHPSLGAFNWVFFREEVDEFQTAFTKFVTAIKSDLDWAHAHSRIQVRALEWQRTDQDSSFLLRGIDLQDAEQRLANAGPEKSPQPTELQRIFVLASRQDATRRQRRGFILVSIALVMVFGLAIAAYIQRGVAIEEANMRATAQVQADEARSTAVVERDLKATAQVVAEHQRDLAISRQLAAQAQALMSERFDLALLLAIESSRGTTDGQLSLSKLLLAEPKLLRIVTSPTGYLWGGGEAGFIDKLSLSPDGNQLVAQSYQGARFWDFETNQVQELTPEQFQQYALDWADFQIPPSNPEDLVQTIDIYSLTYTNSAVPNGEAHAACQTQPSAGGAPGCASLVYIFRNDFERLVTPIAGCDPGGNEPNFGIELEGGLYRIQDLQESDFELYSVGLASRSTDYGSSLVGALYDSQTNRLITVAAVDRFGSSLSMIVWNLEEKKPVMELTIPFWDAPLAQIEFSNGGTMIDVCTPDRGVRIYIDPEAWQAQACELVGRNLIQDEWQQYFPEEKYRRTCSQWPAGE